MMTARPMQRGDRAPPRSMSSRIGAMAGAGGVSPRTATSIEGPMRHSFRLLQELLATDVEGTIRAARARWPEADGRR